MVLQTATLLVSQLKDFGVRIIFVLIGDKTDGSKFREFVEANEDIVESSSFNGLMLKSGDVLQRACVKKGMKLNEERIG